MNDETAIVKDMLEGWSARVGYLSFVRLTFVAGAATWRTYRHFVLDPRCDFPERAIGAIVSVAGVGLLALRAYWHRVLPLFVG